MANDTSKTETTATIEEQIAALQAQVAALQKIVGEESYKLRYSGEQIDKLLDDGNTIFNSYASKTRGQVLSLINRTFPLYAKWGSFTSSQKVNADDGWQTLSNSIKNLFPASVTNPAVFMVCDWAKTNFDAQNFSYAVNGQNVDWKMYIRHSSKQGGTYTFRIYYLVLGKIAGGGTIG